MIDPIRNHSHATPGSSAAGLRHAEAASAAQAGDSTTEINLVDAAWAQFEKITGGVRNESPGRFLAIPGYRILEEIHRGGQGVVYQAIQESTRRKIAIKVLKQGPFADRIELARFEREVDVLSRLNDPHIVAIHDRGLTDGHAYYVMDYVAGKALDAYVTGAEISTDEILTLFAKICDAVNVAHLRGVIHRDLKPGNIRIDMEGEPRILDFGLAKLEEEVAGGSSAQGMTITGQFVGSLPWASPEQAEGEPESLDIRTDVYSLGVILYQLLTNHFPYPVTGRVIDVARHITQTSPERPSSIHRSIDSELELIVLKCLAKEPLQRYQSAGELARDLRLYLADQPILATPPSAAYRLRKFVRRNRGAVIAGSMAVLVLLVATGLSIAFGLSAVRQRAATESALLRAQKAESDAKARAAELERVAKFQEAQLSGINATTMGARLRADLLKKAREAARQLKLPPEELNAQGEKLEKLVAGSDFTGLALGALNDNFFQPALATIERDFAGQPIVQARLLQTLASTLQELGLRDAARAPQEKALEIRRKELGAEHVDTLVSANKMSELLRSQGKLIEAEPKTRETLDTCTRVLGNDHPDTLEAIHNMGLLLQAKGRLEEAEPYLRSAVEKRRRILGEEHLETIISINDLGMLLQARGKLPAAEGYLRESLEKSRRVLGEDHHHTVIALNEMGLQLQEQGKLAEAEAFYREALDRNRRLLGEDHPDTITSIENMAYLYQGQGKPGEAEPYQREALEKTRRVLGDEHPDTLTAINNMAMMLKAQGKLSDAEPYCHEALDKRRRVLGDDHPHTILSIENLGI